MRLELILGELDGGRCEPTHSRKGAVGEPLARCGGGGEGAASDEIRARAPRPYERLARSDGARRVEGRAVAQAPALASEQRDSVTSGSFVPLRVAAGLRSGPAAATSSQAAADPG